MKLLTSFFFLLFLISCQSNEQKGTAQTQTAFVDANVTEFAKLMEGENIVLLDVRTPGETAQGIIEGAIEIDFRENDFAKKVSELDKEKTYLVYCRSGGRSVDASNEMAKQGFKKIYNLLGGYNAWSAEKEK